MGVGQRIIETVLYMCIGLTVLWILDMTLGSVMDALKSAFQTCLLQLHMSSSWMTICGATVTNFDVFFDAFFVVGFALILWAAKTTFIQTTYSRQS